MCGFINTEFKKLYDFRTTGVDKIIFCIGRFTSVSAEEKQSPLVGPLSGKGRLAFSRVPASRRVPVWNIERFILPFST